MTLLRRFGILALGVVLLIVGAVIACTASVSVGWFAYAPLDWDPPVVPPWITPPFVGGFLVLIFGVALIAGWIGYRLARRSPG